MNKRYLSFLPIPALIIIIAVLYSTVMPSAFYDPAWLIPVTNTLFIAVICFAVALIAMRNYGATGRIQILLLGCGVLIFGIGGAMAGFVRGLPDGANLNVTIYNTGALVGALFHFFAALALISGISPETGSKQKDAWLLIGYGGVIIFMALLSLASFRGRIPPFFIQGVGPTPLRQGILGTADVLFAFSFLVFLATYYRNREPFLYWYSLALALTSISLTAFFIQSSVGSPVGWTGRVAQYLGGVYFLIAIMTAIRSAQARRVSFDNVITASLSPAEEKFRALAENSPDIIDRFDNKLQHIYTNPAGLRLYGKPAAAIIGKTMKETGVSEPYCSLWIERIDNVFATGLPLEVEDYFPTADGERFYQFRCVPEFGMDGTVANVLVVSHDLTERKRTEEALRRTKEEWERTFAGVPDLIAILDNKHRILRVNESMARRLGHDPEECVGLHCYEAVHGLPEPPEYCPHRQTLKDGREHVEEVHEENIGGTFLISTTPLRDKRGQMIGSVHVAHDITERKRAEDAIARRNAILTGINRIFKEALVCESEEELAEACLNVALEITGSRFGFVGEIGADGLFHDIAISETGWDACAIYDRSGERRPPANLHIHGIYGRVLLDGKPFFTNDPASHPDRIGVPEGHPAIEAFLGVPLKSGGEPIGMVGLGNREGGYRNEDLEAMEALALAIVQAFIRKRAEQEIVKLSEEKVVRNAELEAVNKELEAFTYSVSHDLRAPLRSINGFSQALLEDCAEKLNAEGKDALGRIQAATRRMGQLIDDLLSLSRMTRIEMTRDKVKLSEIAHEIAGSLKETEPKRQAEFIITENLSTFGDERLLRVALENLLGNAWKFTGKEPHAVIEFGATMFDGGPAYFVRDNGAGFEMKYADRLFNPFQRLHSTDQYPGTGIGLATVKRIVNRHGGCIWAEGELGKGATFYFTCSNSVEKIEHRNQGNFGGETS